MLVFDSKQAIFFLAVMSAARLFDWKLLKKMTGGKSLRFASEEEVASTTRCVPGAVPPFGSLFHVRTLLDQSLIDQGNVINFNAGLRTRSVSMSVSDYLRVESPTIGNFTKAKDPN
jgi:Ala-tRNA(Pro) deacylase